MAIVNQSLAKRLFGSEDVIGQHLRIGREHPSATEIVGVAEDGKYAEVTEPRSRTSTCHSLRMRGLKSPSP